MPVIMMGKRIKILVVVLPLVCVGLFLLVSAVGWVRERQENPQILLRNQQRAAELRSRVERFSGSMPLQEFLHAFPEARMDAATQRYCIVIPVHFLDHSPDLCDNYSCVEFETRDGVVSLSPHGDAGKMINVSFQRGPLYYFFRAWSRRE